jgi:hypothetical protein
MRRFAVFMLVFGLSIGLSVGAWASYVTPLSMEQATDAAAIIVRVICLDVAQDGTEGLVGGQKVAGVSSSKLAQFFYYKLQIKEVLKNTTSMNYAVGDVMVKKIFAGFRRSKGGLAKTSMPVHELKKGNEYVLMLSAKENSVPIGVYQGVFEVVNGKVTSPAMKAMIMRSGQSPRVNKALGVGKASSAQPPSSMSVDDFSGMIKSFVTDKGGAK